MRKKQEALALGKRRRDEEMSPEETCREFGSGRGKERRMAEIGGSCGVGVITRTW